MKSQSGGRTILAFAIPSDARPPEVVEGYEQYDTGANRAAEHDGLIQDVETAELPQAEKRDAEEAVRAARAGKPISNPTKHADATRAKLATLKAARPAFQTAADEAGNELAAAIGKTAEAWANDLAPLEQNAVERYDAAIAVARSALADVRRLRGARAWLAEFDAAEARIGRVVGFRGGAQIIVETVRGHQESAEELLALAAKAGSDPYVPRGSRRHKVSR